MRLIDIEPVLKAAELAGKELVSIDLLKDLEQVDAVPVVRGEWVLLDECSNAGVYCSICHKAVYRESAWYKNVHIKSKFCPNCGARMDGEL